MERSRRARDPVNDGEDERNSATVKVAVRGLYTDKYFYIKF